GCIVDASASAVDSDGDGVADGSDLCPFDPETFNGYLDYDGCPDNPGNCLDGQYFRVRWEVDTGTGAPMLLCNQTPPSHVEITTSFSEVLQVDGTCSDGQLYNWLGYTPSGLD